MISWEILPVNWQLCHNTPLLTSWSVLAFLPYPYPYVSAWFMLRAWSNAKVNHFVKKIHFLSCEARRNNMVRRSWCWPQLLTAFNISFTNVYIFLQSLLYEQNIVNINTIIWIVALRKRGFNNIKIHAIVDRPNQSSQNRIIRKIKSSSPNFFLSV